MTTADAIRPIEPHRSATTENFPVGSWLIPARLRPSVALFYRVARAADDIADSPDLDRETKTARLEAIDRALANGTGDAAIREIAYALELRAHFQEKGLSVDHSRHLLQAFMADAVNRPCRNWSDLMAYCRFSAAPVGRFLLDLHGEDRATWQPGDALCSALQVLNHLQDCQEDYRTLARIYVPTDWLKQNGLGVEALGAARTSPELRKVFDRMLDGCDELNRVAAHLPRRIVDRGLRMEVSAILEISLRLAARLRSGDPLAGRVALSKVQKAAAMLKGAVRGYRKPT
jgi:squalene synthase HpnC